MDSLTQALYGGTVQGALLGRQQGRRSLLYGALLGTLPDLDVVIRYADPISSMTYHGASAIRCSCSPPSA